MGVYTSIYSDNNLFEKNIDYTIEKLCTILEKKISVYNLSDKLILKNDDEYLNVYVDYFDSIKEKFNVDKNLFLRIGNVELYFMEKTIHYCNNSFNWDTYVWSNIIKYLDEKMNNESTLFFKNKFNEIKYSTKIFNSKKMVIFDDDFNQDIEDKIDEGMAIDEILLDKRWLIFTKPDKNISKNQNEEDDYNYLYYEKWENNDDFNINIWKEKYM